MLDLNYYPEKTDERDYAIWEEWDYNGRVHTWADYYEGIGWALMISEWLPATNSRVECTLDINNLEWTIDEYVVS